MLQLGGNITEEGKLRVFDQQKLDAWRLKNSGKDVVLSFKIKRKTRSAAQNGYYWKVVVPMVMEAINAFGNEFDEEETHEFLKAKFNAKEVEVVPDNFIEVPRSTSKLDTKEFMTYIEQIQQFAAAMLGVYIPGPNEQACIDFQ